MKTVTFSVADHAETTRRVLAAAAGRGKGVHFRTFPRWRRCGKRCRRTVGRLFS